MADSDRFITSPAVACAKGATLSPVYGNCSICPNRNECKKMNQSYIQAYNDTQEWCKRCIAEKSPYAKYITYNEKTHQYDCDFEMVELEVKSELEPENLTAFEKMRLDNARKKLNKPRKQNQQNIFKIFFEKVADFFNF